MPVPSGITPGFPPIADTLHMIFRQWLACLFGLLTSLARAEDATAVRQLSFFVSGVECPSCVYVIQQAIAETKGVTQTEVIQMLESEARVAFDPAIVSEHQLTQAVREAMALHGVPYLATLKVRIPGYRPETHAPKLAVVFARWHKSVKIEPLDGHAGTFVIRFQPLEKDTRKPGRKAGASINSHRLSQRRNQRDWV